jgi:2-oxoglutarate dehydrogenase E2 component (dihydrolipoamide succinyltransferase)
MSIVEVKVPQLSESVAEATMLQWKKKAGDTVSADEILIEIETDKVVLEVPAPAAGVLAEILVADGGTVIAEQLIARIDTDGKMSASSASVPAAAAPVAKAVSASTDFAGAVPVASSQAEALSELMTRVDNQLRSQLAETETLLASLYTRASEAEAEARAAAEASRKGG